MRVTINNEILEDIADEIRVKTNTTEKMYPQDMANKISSIESINLSDYFTDVGYSGANAQGGLKVLKRVENIGVSSSTLSYAFASATNLTYISFSSFYSYNLNVNHMFESCTNLVNISFGNITQTNFITRNGFQYMFSNCTNLSDNSINEILNLCLHNPSYQYSKTLAELGFKAANYPASRIQALSNYQAFLNAGWTIGY